MFPVDLDSYRASVSALGAKRRAAVIRLELTTDILRKCVVAAVAAGMSENEAAKLAGVTRQAVRSWRGK